MQKPVRVCILVLFAALFATQTALWFEEAEVGARNSDLVEDGTYQREFYTRSEDDYLVYLSDFVTKSDEFNVSMHWMLHVTRSRR
eukprot:m.850576 g.850576  ORF g.850576 m.850576 type:complete len:85 (+) comp23491_c0_seq45:3231-3485(+)